jgi:hypothetical protein
MLAASNALPVPSCSDRYALSWVAKMSARPSPSTSPSAMF